MSITFQCWETLKYLLANTVIIKINNTTTMIYFVYWLPKQKISQLEFNYLLNSLGHTFIIGGELNVKYTKSKYRGIVFNNLVEK